MKRKFGCAFTGIIKALRVERGMRVHLVFAIYILLAAAVTDASRLEWCAVLICIGSVISAELLNTAVERLCDALHPGRSIKIAAVKDIAAGAVLAIAAASAVVGCVIFFSPDKIRAAIHFFRYNIPLTALIAASVPVAIYLTFRRYDK